jgi:AcrR family transcriptional regulator
MPKGIPLTEAEQAKRRQMIFQQAVKVILKKGFQETSMREIAEAAGLGKSTLYDYFPTKDDILVYFFENQWSDLTEEAQRIAVQNSTADIRFRLIMDSYLASMQDNKSLFLKISFEAQRLKPENQKLIQEKQHAYQDLICALIDEGSREGVFRQVNSLLAARLLLGAVGPIIVEPRFTGMRQERQEMMEQTLDIFFQGIAVRKQK